MVKVKKDLTGMRFGKLVVLEQAEDYIQPSGRRKAQWLCQCDCGEKPIIRGDALTSGKTQSCGCYHKECAKKLGMQTFDDLTGKKFGRLLVIERVSKIGEIPVLYKCLCDCGELCIVRADLLRNGATSSCGCYNRELISERNKARKGIKIGRYKENRYEFLDDYIIGYDSNNNHFYIDTEDFDKIKDYTWYVNQVSNYVVCVNEKIYMHNLILPCEIGFVADHINGHKNRPDNRKQNLRQVTDQQNNFNRDKGSNNTSGFIGVGYDKEKNIYEAYIGLNYKTIHLGYFNSFTMAVKARIEAEIKYFGEHMYTSHLKILDYINSGNSLQYGNSEQIENILNS